MSILNRIDSWLNDLTMYRLLLYGLSIIAGIAVLYSALGDLSFSVGSLLTSVAILVTVCYVTSRIFSAVWKVPANAESSLITALILFFILQPAVTPAKALALGIAGILAISSKYILNVRGKHIFNPAAFAALVVGLLGITGVTWWIATPVLLPLTIILGLLVLRKLGYFSLFLVFAGSALLVMAELGLYHGHTVPSILSQAFTSWPLIFMGTIMLTEPATLPPRQKQQLILGVLVGVVFASQLRLGMLQSTPQVALLLGNVFAFAVSPRYRLKLRLLEKHQPSKETLTLTFKTNAKVSFQPGQYLEWTMAHKGMDSRGNRRTFSIASSPTENNIQIGAKIPKRSSSYKKALLALQPGDTLFAGQLAGEFTLPKDGARPLVFVAGGIGITPFRSMLQYLHDTNEIRDIVLLYFVPDLGEAMYADVLKHAKEDGVRIVMVLTAKPSPNTWKGHTGHITKELLEQEVPDYPSRLFYVSGPDGMVRSARLAIRAAGVSDVSIKTDHFSGY